VGSLALLNNDNAGHNNATDNTAVGANALRANFDGNFNNAFGSGALAATAGGPNPLGSENNAFGHLALNANVVGQKNTAIGDDALQFSLGDRNTAVGNEAGALITGGTNNVAVGDNAMGLVGNPAITGVANTVVGIQAGPNIGTGNTNTYIGAGVTGVLNESFTIRLADNLNHAVGATCFVGGIDLVTPPGVLHNVQINANGQLGSTLSSRRFKKDIVPIDKSSEGVLALKPVTFRYKSDYTNSLQFGLIAEEVAQVNPDWTWSQDGAIVGVRYDAINILLLNEFLKEHKKVEAQQAKVEAQQASIAELKSTVGVLTAQLKEQAAQIQKVSAELEVNKPAAKVVVNKP
jgi:Chaperone of endosialidase